MRTLIILLSLISLPIANAEHSEANRPQELQSRPEAPSQVDGLEKLIADAGRVQSIQDFDELEAIDEKLKRACQSEQISKEKYIALHNKVFLRLLERTHEEEIRQLKETSLPEEQRGTWVEKARKDQLKEFEQSLEAIRTAQKMEEKEQKYPFRSLFDVYTFVGKETSLGGHTEEETAAAQSRINSKIISKKIISKKSIGNAGISSADSILELLRNSQSIPNRKTLARKLRSTQQHQVRMMKLRAMVSYPDEIRGVKVAVDSVLSKLDSFVCKDLSSKDLQWAGSAAKRLFGPESELEKYLNHSRDDLSVTDKFTALLRIDESMSEDEKEQLSEISKASLARLNKAISQHYKSAEKETDEQEPFMPFDLNGAIEEEIELVKKERAKAGLGESSYPQSLEDYWNTSRKERGTQLELAQNQVTSLLRNTPLPVEYRLPGQEETAGDALIERLGLQNKPGRTQTADQSHLYLEPVKQQATECVACGYVSGLEFVINRERKENGETQTIDRLSREFAFAILKGDEGSLGLNNNLAETYARKGETPRELAARWNTGTFMEYGVFQENGIPTQKAYPRKMDNFVPSNINAVEGRVHAMGEWDRSRNGDFPALTQQNMIRLLEGGHHPVIMVAADARRSALGQIQYMPEMSNWGHVINVTRYIPETRDRLTGKRTNGQFEVMDSLEGETRIFRVDANDLMALSGEVVVIKSSKTLDKPKVYPNFDK